MSGNSVNVVFFGTKEVASLALRDLAKVFILKRIIKPFHVNPNQCDSGVNRKPGKVCHFTAFEAERLQVLNPS